MKEKLSAASVKIDKKNNFAPHLHGADYVFQESSGTSSDNIYCLQRIRSWPLTSSLISDNGTCSNHLS